MGPSPAAKRSLGFLPPPTASSLKRQRPLSSDYTGWNKSKVLLSQQSQLQGLVQHRICDFSFFPSFIYLFILSSGFHLMFIVRCACFVRSFSNLGNTCYMNAILQSLFALQPFSHDLLKQRIPWKKVPQNTLLRCRLERAQIFSNSVYFFIIYIIIIWINNVTFIS